MTGDLVPFERGSSSNRYTDVEREQAYQLWRVSAGRSLRRLATLIPPSFDTLKEWSAKGQWRQRAATEDAESVDLLRGAVGSLISEQLVQSIQTMITIRDDITASAKDRLNAAQWLAGVAGISPVHKASTSFVIDDAATTRDNDRHAAIAAQPASELTDFIVRRLTQPTNEGDASSA